MSATSVVVGGYLDTGDYNNQNDEVNRVIEEYTPVMASDQWESIAKFVRNTVHSHSPSTVSVARAYLAATAQFVQWSWQTAGLDVGAEMFTHHNVARFINQVMSAKSGWYQYHSAQRLNRLVTHLTGKTTKQLVAPESRASQPYPEVDFIEFRSSAARRSNEARRRNAHVLLALGAGAGLRAEEIALARVGDVFTEGAGLVVGVRGRHPRRVPVRTEWCEALGTGLGERNGEEWAFTGYRIPQYPARVIHQFHLDDRTESTPQATRLRATWIVQLLQGSVPINLVLSLAGLADVVSLGPYVKALPAASYTTFRPAITGQAMR